MARNLIISLIFLCFISLGQNAYYTDSLTKALPLEKNLLKKCFTLLALSDEWKERDGAVSEKYFADHYEVSKKVLKPEDKAELVIKRSYILSNRKEVKRMKTELDSVKDFILQSKNDFLIGKYWCAYGNYVRMDHEETDEDHQRIVEIFKRSINILQKYNPEEVAKAYYILVTFYTKERDDPKGLNQFTDEFEAIAVKLRDHRLRAKYLHQLGLIHHNFTHKEPLSLSCYIEALKDYKLIRDSLNIGGLKINIGERNMRYGDKEKGEQLLMEGVDICKRNVHVNPKKANQNMSSAYYNVAALCTDSQKEKCLDAYKKSLFYNSKAKNFYREPLVLGDMSQRYAAYGMLDSAFYYERTALSMRIKFGNKEGEVYSYGTLAKFSYQAELYDSAITYGQKALELANKTKFLSYQNDPFEALYKSHEKLKNYEKAFYFLDRLNIFTDSIKKSRSEKEIKSLINKQKEELAQLEFDKKHAIDQAEIERNQFLIDKNEKELLILEQENNLKAYSLEKSKTILHQKQLESDNHKKAIEVLNAETRLKDAEAQRKEVSIKQQQTVIYSVSLGGLIVLALLILAVKGYRQKQKDNKLIAMQKNEVEQQKHLVDEKNKEILDSITYAKRLQDAILPPDNFVKTYLPENFILYLPKDIVAGDFYWMEVIKNNGTDQVLIAAADSTGHGVPGAMVSVVCSNALNRSVKEFNLSEPGKILDKTRELVLETFAKSTSEVKDGMDISLLSINIDHAGGSFNVNWAGANNPLWYFKNGTFNELKPNKQPIGKTDAPVDFSTNTIEYVKDSIFYLFTDGYADQFGGPRGKKFKYKQLEEILTRVHTLPLKDQENFLKQKFNEWKGNLEQVDDVCVIGLKL